MKNTVGEMLSLPSRKNQWPLKRISYDVTSCEVYGTCSYSQKKNQASASVMGLEESCDKRFRRQKRCRVGPKNYCIRYLKVKGSLDVY